MSKSNDTATAILALIYNATAWADLAQNDGSGPATNIYVALHTADPTDSGAQNASEANYSGYTRIPVVRTSSGWTVSTGAVTNAAEILFPECVSGSNTITHFSTGVGSSGATPILHSGALSASRAISAGIAPRFAAGELDITED